MGGPTPSLLCAKRHSLLLHIIMNFRSLFKKKLASKVTKDDRLASPSPDDATPAGASSSSRPGEKYGLHCLTPSDDDADGLAFGPDIVAIHGLNGDPFRTWSHENGSLWLRDFLPSELPTSRVYTFGYSSEVVFTKSRGTIDQWARMLLNALNFARRTEVRLEVYSPISTYTERLRSARANVATILYRSFKSGR